MRTTLLNQTTLGGAILHVVELRADEQVRRIHTERRVTRMTDHAGRGHASTVRHLPGDAMRRTDVLTVADLTVAVENGGGPQPAASRRVFIDFRPEAIFNRDAAGEGVAVARAILRSGELQPDAAPAASLQIRFRFRVRFRRPNITSIIGPNTISSNFSLLQLGIRPMARLFRTHATPIRISNGTRVLSLMAFATRGRGAPRLSSTRAYNACVTPSTRAASRWFISWAVRHAFNEE